MGFKFKFSCILLLVLRRFCRRRQSRNPIHQSNPKTEASFVCVYKRDVKAGIRRREYPTTRPGPQVQNQVTISTLLPLLLRPPSILAPPASLLLSSFFRPPRLGPSSSSLLRNDITQRNNEIQSDKHDTFHVVGTTILEQEVDEHD